MITLHFQQHQSRETPSFYWTLLNVEPVATAQKVHLLQQKIFKHREPMFSAGTVVASFALGILSELKQVLDEEMQSAEFLVSGVCDCFVHCITFRFKKL